MDQIASLYPEHISELNKRVANALEKESLTALVIHSGQAHRVFLDDQYYPFKVNPQFKAWLPLLDNPHCFLIVNGTNKPQLIFYRPVDFWHKITDIPDDFWTDSFDIKVMTKLEDLTVLLPKNLSQHAYIGEHTDYAQELGFQSTNPKTVIDYLHYHRASKTAYELACMRLSNKIAVKGHLAAKKAFFDGASEYEIQQQYLLATDQTENEQPYSAIVALNENSAILHYTKLERSLPAERLSFLIDAGANYNGYTSDITRTYSFEENIFSELIAAVDKAQLELISMMKPGVDYVDLHLAMHQKISQILLDFKIASGDLEGLIEQGITSVFLPHGLGHQLGLQVHDMGGFLSDELGSHRAAPAAHPFLRCTRTLAENQVLTMEPGLYIIDSLLNTLKNDKRKSQINWQVIDQLRPFGGIRIEDNVIVHADRIENMTRDFGLN